MTTKNTGEMERDRRDISRGARQILSGFGVRMLARVLLIVFVAKLFGAAVFGRLGETVAIIELAAAFASFGLTKTLLGEMARDESVGEHITTRFVEALILTGIVSLGLAGVLWSIWPTLFPTDAAPRISVIGVPLIALTDVALTATRHHRTVAWDTIVKAAIKPWSFLILALASYALVTGRFTVTFPNLSMPHALIGAYLGSLTVSALVAFAATSFMFRGGVKRAPNSREILGMARRSFPIALNETGVFAFRRVDILLLGMVAGPAATGIYYLAQQIGTVVEKVRYLFEPMLAPIIAQSNSMALIGSHVRRLCLFVFTVQLSLLVLALLNSDGMLMWFGPGFAAGSGVLVLILLGELFDGSFGLSELPLIFRHPKWPPRAVLAALAVECALVMVLARQFGAAGAAAGFAASMFVLAVIRLALVRRKFGFHVISPVYAGILLAAVLSAIPAFALTVYGADAWAVSVAANLIFLLIYGGVAYKLLRSGGRSLTAEITSPSL
ncbi:lipopolysaccharide biosynthesis protein [Hyphococcus sp.]|uniref:lipopolysaccharide biosynthesis protein n=1 Tax=Hyphococcus sp. TaxID=2038636 RepID=UPI002085A4C8|nr:MAG: flippase [Marinicaulis sp.]